MDKKIIIRDLTMDDIDQVCVIEEETFSMPWHRESFVDMVNNPNALYIVASDDDGVIYGCAGALSIVGEGSICNIVVKSDYRSQGIGELITRELLSKGVREFGIEAYTLEVRVSNEPARKLYEKLGFVNEGIRPGYYEKPVEDACIYWLRDIKI